MTRKQNLRNWRADSDIRYQMNALTENFEALVQENDELREAINEQRQEIADEVKEEIRDYYEDQLKNLVREKDKWQERYEMAQTELEEMTRLYEELREKMDSRMSAIRDMLGITVNNIDGNYIENQNVNND